MRLLHTLLCLLTTIGCFAPCPMRAVDAVAYAIADQTTGHVLESENAQKKVQVASLTKMATALVVFDWAEARKIDLGQLATVPTPPPGVATAEGVGFRPGDRCSLRDLLYAALMQSDNLAAETLADHVGRTLASAAPGAVTVFVAQMNALARRLGMNRTLFLNAHGLDTLERKLPHSTAEDIMRLTVYAMKNAAFRFHVSQKERTISIITASGETTAYLLRNTNELLGQNSVDGVKTGTTRRAGACLVLSATRAPESRQEGETVHITPRRLNIVLLGARDRFQVGSQLLSRGWQLHEEWAAAGRPTASAQRRRK